MALFSRLMGQVRVDEFGVWVSAQPAHNVADTKHDPHAPLTA